jgi:hypothetical protein
MLTCKLPKDIYFMKRNCMFKYLSVLCLIICISVSCNTGIDLGALDDSSVLFDESLVVPVGEANMTVKEFLTKITVPSTVDTAANEIFFKWSFTDNMVFKSLKFSDSIPPFNKNLKLGEILPNLKGIPLPANYPFSFIVKDSFKLGVNGNETQDRIDSVTVNSSQIDVSLSVSDDLKTIPPSDFKLQFVFPDKKVVVENGVPEYVPTKYNDYGQISIGKYKMYLNGMTTLPYQLIVKLKTNNTIVLTDNSRIVVNMKFSTLNFAVTYGFFHLDDGDHKVLTIPFKIDDYLPGSNIKFANPLVKLTASTNIGADINIKADYLSAYNSSDPSKTVWAWFDNHTTKEKIEKLHGPTSLGNWSSTTFAPYDSINGETDQLFENSPYPNKLDYNFAVLSDPARSQNYVTPDGKVILKVDIQIPLAIKGNSNYAFSDTIPNLNVGTTLDKIDSAVLVLKLSNGLPLRAKYRMTFWKSELLNDTISAVGGITKIADSSVLGNMFSQYQVNSPLVDGVGNVTQVVPQFVKIMLNKTQINALTETKFIVFHVSLDTDKTVVNGVETSNAVHLTTNNSFGVKLGIFLKGNYTTNIGKAN